MINVAVIGSGYWGKYLVCNFNDLGVLHTICDNYDKGVEWVNRQPVPRKNEAQIIPIDTWEPLKAECAHFLECIKFDSAPKTDGNNGIQVLKMLNACQGCGLDVWMWSSNCFQGWCCHLLRMWKVIHKNKERN